MAMKIDLLRRILAVSSSVRYARPTGRARALMLSLLACITFGVALTACSSASNSSSAEGGAPHRPGAGGSSWQNPIDGVTISSLTAAQQYVNFPIIALPGLGNPSTILVTPNQAPTDTVVVVQYQNSSSGLINVYEETTSMSSTDFQNMIDSWVAVNGKPETEGSSTAVTLNNKLPALITTTADGSNSDIRWIQGGVEYTIRGPSLTQQACITFANALTAAASTATT
jgi:hypothetical protein